MFLKSLTLKGFKSFADKTTLDVEPGVTVVVGPNGSGKSNVVDAVAWVLGAQGARALRGGSMDDVIFAGTAQRPALGRAEVSLTIDNTGGRLPIEFSEVTITRTLFRTGESDYQINGAPCRLLDIQELLSDSGIGRTQHVIVGQGRLDAVLTARPEDRRAVIEEAAGILKFRKRKERAERRLASTEANLARLTDLLREVRRQLRPLERQADAARRHDTLAGELAGIRLHLAGRDLASLQGRIERQRAARAELATAESTVRHRLEDLDGRVVAAEHTLAGPTDDDLDQMILRAEALRERGRSLVTLVGERHRALERELATAADEGVVESLVAEASSLRAEREGVEADWANLAPTRREVDEADRRVAARRAELDAAVLDDGAPREARARREAEAASAAAARELDAARAELARRDEVDAALEAEGTATDAAIAEVAEALAALGPDEAAHDAARRALAEETDTVAREDEAALGAARRAREEAEEHLAAAEERHRAAASAASRWRARAETLAAALAEAQEATGADALHGVEGVLGPLVDGLEIVPGYEVAVDAALGDAARAVVVAGPSAARAAIGRLKAGDVAARLLVAEPTSGPSPAVPDPSRTLPPGARWLRELVRATRADVDAALAHHLAGVVVVDGWAAAVDLVTERPDLVAVSRTGDRFGGGRPWRTGPSGSSVVTPAACEEAEAEAGRAEEAERAAADAVGVARTARREAARAEAERQRQSDAARADLDRRRREADTRGRALELRRAGLEARGAELESRRDEIAARRSREPELRRAGADRVDAAAASAETTARALAEARAAEREAATRLREARAELERLRSAATKLRRDFEVRGAGLEARRRGIEARLAAIEARLAARPDEEAAAERRRAEIASRQAALGALGERLEARRGEIEQFAGRLLDRRRARTEAARDAGRRLDDLRRERAAAERELGEIRERAGRSDIEAAELALRLEGAVEAVRRDFDREPEAALDAPAPAVPEGTTLAGRARELERELRLMGPVNPLALSEYEAHVERHEFLQGQLDDVKASRRELQRVITAVDREIVTVFEEAFADVSRHFVDLFATLFPGGSGRLVLTDPTDLLATGIEIEARPSGKTVRRLSLLSGGERSLTALAYLFAVFRARPSPFYMLDEVEAALDDLNLHRFLDLLAEFRRDAQLLVVSHQKRTMEAADVLYGVSMPPGGSSRVVSQRMSDLHFEPA